MNFYIPHKTDGTPPPADILAIYAELEFDENQRLAWQEARVRIAKGTHSAATRELMASFENDDLEDAMPVLEPEIIAYARNSAGQNTLALPPVKVDNQPWRVIDVASLAGRCVPVREWIVPQWLPIRVATLLYADGGVGKTLLAMQLMAACATGGKWCGLPVTPCKSIGLFSEDDTSELHIRLEGIRQHHGLTWDDMADMCPIDATGQDNTLVRFERDGRMVLTPRFNRLKQQAMDTGARLVVIDTAATTFGGNEIDRAQVTQFVGTALTGLAQSINGAVLLNAHPSVSGLASGDLRSGSTAWNNSCRSRWALARPLGDDGKPLLGSDERTLQRQKANAARSGDTIAMRWENGVFLTSDAATGVATASRKDGAETAFLEGLKAKQADGIHVSHNKNSPRTWAPRQIANSPEGRDFKQNELLEAMNNLMKRGVIKIGTYKQNYKEFEELNIVREGD